MLFDESNKIRDPSGLFPGDEGVMVHLVVLFVIFRGWHDRFELSDIFRISQRVLQAHEEANGHLGNVS